MGEQHLQKIKYSFIYACKITATTTKSTSENKGHQPAAIAERAREKATLTELKSILQKKQQHWTPLRTICYMKYVCVCVFNTRA